ncbi:cpr-5 [Pristionchus pacificus]|uniref:Cpr-5 n=1 Tax=Pristionchus pacificus TaxID=54126 RepID=A0A2A6CRZ9_PRIPA|nr:cpr-5 [Pristionchus pacificus]|eukprot:PDM80878.1 cpr-5 [Pristionchus pacificus]
MKLAVALALFGAVSAYNLLVRLRHDVIPNAATQITGEALRDYVNHAQKLFKAEVPKKSHRNHLMAIKHTRLPEDTKFKADVPISASLPTSFDSREQWPMCSGIGAIRDQSDCGSCWAFGAAEAMSDRVCIASKGTKTPTLSADDLLSCCGFFCGYGCEGGYPIRAWTYMTQKGICTGGGFYENVGCKPYPIEPCGTHTVDGTTHYHNCTGIPDPDTPTCTAECTNKDYTTKYADDKYYGKSAYAVKRSVDAIKQEIFDNGPVEVAFTVYEDFDQYTGGIYKHVAGAVLGGHAVKMIGWGVEDGTPYWLVANSWNVEWGEKGFFRIISGTNECGIEEAVVAGLPAV